MLSLEKITKLIKTLSIITLLPINNLSVHAETPPPTIAITQIIQHGALDEERRGVVDALKKRGYADPKTAKIVAKNAQGSVANAAQIASDFAGLDNLKVIIAISTPSAQYMMKTCERIPCIFTAVTNPKEAGLVGKKNMTGVSDALPAGPQIQMLKEILPDLKVLGIVYNAGEANSVSQLKDWEDALRQEGITLIAMTAGNTAQVPQVTTSLIGKLAEKHKAGQYAIMVINDNTSVAALKSMLGLAYKHKIPLFAADTGSVKDGAIATVGYDRYKLGYKAGLMAADVLDGRATGDILIASDHATELFINLKSAKKMGLEIPEALVKKAVLY